MKDKFILVGLGISAAIAGGLSLFASSQPDGLEKVAEDTGFIDTATDSVVAGSPLADYSFAGIEGTWSSTLAGAFGVAVTALVGYGLYLWMRAPQSK
ncbi:MAG: hypothetical protein RL038_3 [Actinomycetota bacterium]